MYCRLETSIPSKGMIGNNILIARSNQHGQFGVNSNSIQTCFDCFQDFAREVTGIHSEPY